MKYIKFIEKYLGRIISDNYQYISHWWDYDVIIYDNMIYRFPKWSKIKDLAVEKRVLDIIRPYVSLPIPNFTIVDDDFVVYPCIQWQILNDCDVIYSDDLILDLVWFIKQLHDIPLNYFDFVQSKSKSVTELRQWAYTTKDTMNIRLNWKVPSEVINNLHEYIDQLCIAYESPATCMVHCDLQWDNIIYDQKIQKLVWIIDFSDCRTWVPELDFCRFAYKKDNLLERMVVAYRWYLDEWFIARARFFAKKTIISQIRNDKVYYDNFKSILDQLKKYEFI